MKKKIIIAIIIIAALVIAGVVGYDKWDRADRFVGDAISNPDFMYLDFELMNRTEIRTFTYSEGDELLVDFDITKGQVDLLIKERGGEVVFRGNDIQKANFILTIPEDGDYDITVSARHAAGRVTVGRNIEE